MPSSNHDASPERLHTVLELGWRFAKIQGRGVVNLCIASAVLIVLAVGYIFVAEYRAKSKAIEFCQEIRPGQNTDDLLTLAWEAGADRRRTRWLQHRDSWSLPVTFIGALPMDRHICFVDADEGKVTHMDYHYLD